MERDIEAERDELYGALDALTRALSASAIRKLVLMQDAGGIRLEAKSETDTKIAVDLQRAYAQALKLLTSLK